MVSIAGWELADVVLRQQPSVADDEACLMEHDLSMDTMNKMYSYLEERGIAVDDERFRKEEENA